MQDPPDLSSVAPDVAAGRRDLMLVAACRLAGLVLFSLSVPVLPPIAYAIAEGLAHGPMLEPHPTAGWLFPIGLIEALAEIARTLWALPWIAAFFAAVLPVGLWMLRTRRPPLRLLRRLAG